MKNFIPVIILLSLMACDQSRLSSGGFSLPEGDPENGELVFFEMNCIQCHVLEGTDFNGEEERLLENGGIAVKLGGEVTRVQSYEDLVTSIINPSHRIAKGYALDVVTQEGESAMAYYNEVMTVSELVDLVTFLKSKYELKSYPQTVYPYYVYPG
jgi:sulfur-oxidizing protein SoxX